jgi:hypothetical protein
VAASSGVNTITGEGLAQALAGAFRRLKLTGDLFPGFLNFNVLATGGT